MGDYSDLHNGRLRDELEEALKRGHLLPEDKTHLNSEGTRIRTALRQAVKIQGIYRGYHQPTVFVSKGGGVFVL